MSLQDSNTCKKVQSVKLANPYTPSSYTVHIDVNLTNWTYQCNETVHLKRNADVPYSNVIKLHAADSIQIISIQGARCMNRNKSTQTMQMQLLPRNTPLPLQEYTVRFHFRHIIQSQLRGFYQVRFKQNEVQHRMASTHFEPTAARLFYICQDQPAARADFTLIVSLPSEQSTYTVLSNGPLKSKEIHGSRSVYIFDTIPSCPPYLTACVVGQLAYVQDVVDDVVVRIYTTATKINRAAFALKIVKFALQYFANFFQCKFPLPKLDVVAVPDFPIGGMENWGCITCVESILVEEGKSSVNALKRASELLCHEVSHNWFGNLVAINWWEGLWLKEGFASWCGNVATYAFQPKWNSLAYAAGKVGEAMETDMYDNSHPVQIPIADPADITQIFDSISYDKGMGLVFMLQNYLGTQQWGPAIAHYINIYKFRDTRTVQLWSAIEESSHKPITKIMQTFTNQMNYPLVHVNRTNSNTLHLRHEPCLFASSQRASTLKCTSPWNVPILIKGNLSRCNESHNANQNNTSFVQNTMSLILNPVIDIKGEDKDNYQQVQLNESLASCLWLTVNPNRYGFYRCRYDDNLFKEWINQYTCLSNDDKRALISDIFACVKMGLNDVDRIVSISDKVKENERDIFVLQQYFSCTTDFISMFADKGTRHILYEEMISYALSIVNVNYLSSSLDHKEKDLQNKLIDVSLSLISAGVLNKEKWTSQITSLTQWAVNQVQLFLMGGQYNISTISHALELYVRSCDISQVDERNGKLFAKLRDVDGNDELCRAVINALCVGKNITFVKQFAFKCICNSDVRSQYGGIVFNGMANNHSFGENELWEYFKNNFEAIKQQWGGGQFRIQWIVSIVGKTVSCDKAKALEFEQFFTHHPLPNATFAIARAVEHIHLRSWINDKWSNKVVELVQHNANH